MDKFLISGPSKLRGNIEISGSKNSALPILASTLLFDKPVMIKNIPNVKDIDTMLNLLKSLGLKIIHNKRYSYVKIVKSNKTKTFASYSLVKTMRAGILVLGPLAAKYKKAVTSLPGGCLIGARPVNFHLSALKKLGMNYTIKEGYIHAHVRGNLKGNKIKFSKISVGATENLIIASCLADGQTILKNCAVEPEIKDLTNFLNKAGAKIKWTGKRTISINGVKSLNSLTYSIMGDRIECGTFCVAAALTEGQLKIKGFNPKLINTELNLLKRVGANIKTSKNEIFIKGPKKIKNVKFLKTKEYPSFPTDLQAQFMSLMCIANGKSVIEENIFENRFMHVPELSKMKASIKIDGNKAFIDGLKQLQGASVKATDLRASMSLIAASLNANGESVVNHLSHLKRGYENFEEKLFNIGAHIR